LERQVLYVLASGADFWAVVVNGEISLLLTGVESEPAGFEVVLAGRVVDSVVVKVSEVIEQLRAVHAEQLTMDLSEAEFSKGMSETVERWRREVESGEE
jgi:hypothetical protein